MKALFLLSAVLVAANLLNSLHKPTKTTFAATIGTKVKKRTSMPVTPVNIIIDKSDYELQVYDQKGWYATYPVVFGNSTLADKKMEGDRCTPEGTFKIVSKRPHEKWHRFMGLNYPTQESLQKFKERKERGEIPKNASPGGGIGIHGTWPHDEFMIDRYKNWTNGCVALKNEDMAEVYGFITVGTEVTIRK
jgi:murein L,D-transpeptidase YafK